MVSDAFGRSATALAAVRETMLVAAVLGALLLWFLARRLGLTRWAAAAAVLLLAASPLALGLQRLVVVEHLAAVWALGALVLITKPDARIRHDVLAAVCLLAAVLTSPLALFFLPAAGWLLVRRAPVRAALVAVLLNLGLGIAFGPAAGILRPHLAAAGRPLGRRLGRARPGVGGAVDRRTGGRAGRDGAAAVRGVRPAARRDPGSSPASRTPPCSPCCCRSRRCCWPGSSRP